MRMRKGVQSREVPHCSHSPETWYSRRFNEWQYNIRASHSAWSGSHYSHRERTEDRESIICWSHLFRLAADADSLQLSRIDCRGILPTIHYDLYPSVSTTCSQSMDLNSCPISDSSNNDLSPHQSL